jgi:hypothetical protein
MEPRVLLIVFDPVVDAYRNSTLSQVMHWNQVDDLVSGYIADIEECSAKLVKYQVVEKIEVNKFPIKADGYRYTATSYLDTIHRRIKAHDPDQVDYHQILENFNVLERIQRKDIDEVWLMGYPYAGFYESRMAGRGAFWCNAPPLENTDSCPRRFVIMGFSYERGVGEMLEDMGHRVESIMDKTFEGSRGESNLWKLFTRYDKITPGQAQVGNVHFAPNSERDYDWGNRRMVASKCDDWLNFPHLKGITRMVNCSEWGNGDIRFHHKWWLSHLPKVEGSTSGVSNNWWEYFIELKNILASA